MSQRPDYPLFSKLIDRVLQETDIGLLSQFVELIRILVDTETLEEVRPHPLSPSHSPLTYFSRIRRQKKKSS